MVGGSFFCQHLGRRTEMHLRQDRLGVRVGEGCGVERRTRWHYMANYYMATSLHGNLTTWQLYYMANSDSDYW